MLYIVHPYGHSFVHPSVDRSIRKPRNRFQFTAQRGGSEFSRKPVKASGRADTRPELSVERQPGAESVDDHETCICIKQLNLKTVSDILIEHTHKNLQPCFSNVSDILRSSFSVLTKNMFIDFRPIQSYEQ